MQKINSKSALEKQVPKFLPLIILFLSLFLIFPRKISINKYINESHFKYCGMTVLKSTFIKDFAYRTGRAEGIIVHSTDSKSSARHDAESFLENGRKRQAYVHAFVDDKEILQNSHTVSIRLGCGISC